MRIGFDCVKLVKGKGKSIGIYNVAKSVVTNMAGKLPLDCHIVVFGNEKNRVDFDIEGVEFIPVSLDVDSKKALVMWELFGINKIIKQYKIDRIVFPRGYTSLFCPAQDTIIVHDLIPFFYNKEFPGYFGKLENAYIMFRLKQSIRLAHNVITISEYSKQEIIKKVPSSAGKITVIHHGFDRRSKMYDVEPATEDYIIGVTSALPHKNAKGLVKAYCRYYDISANPAKLVLAGLDSLEAAGIEVGEKYKYSIECKRFLGDKEYFSLFKNAKVLLFLPLIEGFGLPPLEAMELGVPVISSDRSSLPEVVKDAGILADPDNTDVLAQALEKVMTDAKYRKDLIFNGYINLNSFRWEDKIKQYIKVIVGE